MTAAPGPPQPESPRASLSAESQAHGEAASTCGPTPSPSAGATQSRVDADGALHAGSLRRWGLAALLTGATGIGFAPILVRLSEVGPSATAFYRVLFALPLLWLWLAGERRLRPATPRPRHRSDFLWLGTAGLFFAADLAVWHWSLQFTTVANSTLLTNFAPLFVTLGAWLLLKEKITGHFLLGMVAALAGAGLLVNGSVSIGHRLRGDALALATAVFYAGYLLLVKRLRHSFSTATIMAWSGVASCPAFLLFALLPGERLVPVSATGWLVLFGLALVSHVGGQALIAYGIGHLPASFSSLSLLWQPAVAAAAAAWFFQEHMALGQMFGGLIVLLGIAVASRTPVAVEQTGGASTQTT